MTMDGDRPATQRARKLLQEVGERMQQLNEAGQSSMPDAVEDTDEWRAVVADAIEEHILQLFLLYRDLLDEAEAAWSLGDQLNAGRNLATLEGTLPFVVNLSNAIRPKAQDEELLADVARLRERSIVDSATQLLEQNIDGLEGITVSDSGRDSIDGRPICPHCDKVHSRIVLDGDEIDPQEFLDRDDIPESLKAVAIGFYNDNADVAVKTTRTPITTDEDGEESYYVMYALEVHPL
jgi:hypothetical protein